MAHDPEKAAETVDQLKERRGELKGIAKEAGGDPASFYPDTDAYPASSGTLPPTGGLDQPSPTDALHPADEHDDVQRESGPRDEQRPGRVTGGPIEE